MDSQDANRMVNNVDPNQTALQSDLCSLIWVYIVCPDLSVRNFRSITAFVSFSFQFELQFLHANSVTMIRRRKTRRLIRICTVSQSPKNGMLGTKQ